MENKKFKLVLFVILQLNEMRNTKNEQCLKQADNHFYSNIRESVRWSLLVDFKNFNELILDCNQTYNITPYVAMWPKYPLVIDENFRLDKVFNQTQINSIAILELDNLMGVDLNSRSFIFAPGKLIQKIIILKVSMSKFNIYSNSVLIENEKCDMVTYNTSLNFFKYFFKILLRNVEYPKVWCPYFFKDFHLAHLFLLDITNSFLIKNRLNFYQLNSSNHTYLKYLVSLQLYLTYESLNRNSLSPELFQKMNMLTIRGILDGIEMSLFQNFRDLRVIDFEIGNLREFFHTGNQWMLYLNLDFNVTTIYDFKRILGLRFIYLKRIFSFASIYEYPDEDLCLFKNFPHERLVYSIIIPGKKLVCTCTLYWLQSNLHEFKSELEVMSDYNQNYEENTLRRVFLFCDNYFNASECNFNQRLNMCRLNVDLDTLRSFNDDEIFYFIKFMEFVLIVVLGPLFCLIGIIHNGLTILVIKDKNKKREFQEPMYKHMILNATFNILYCLIVALKLINTCIFYGPSVFCSNVYQEDWAQTFKIILIHFLGNAIKMCSNVSYLTFSLSRLLLITRQKNENLNISSKYKNVFISIYVFLLVLISFTLNSFKLFQYKINIKLYSDSSKKEFPFEIRDEQYCSNQMNKFQCQLFNAFKIANRSLNDVLFVILNILIDLILFIRFKRHMANKLCQINDLAQRISIEKSKKNVNRMILLNSFIYVFSHLPEFTTTLLLIVFSKKISNFCSNKFSCDLLNEEAEFFGLISIVCQFYVFKIFDNNFKRSFNDLVNSFLNIFKRPKQTENSKDEIVFKNINNLIGNGLID